MLVTEKHNDDLGMVYDWHHLIIVHCLSLNEPSGTLKKTKLWQRCIRRNRSVQLASIDASTKGRARKKNGFNCVITRLSIMI